MAVKLCEAKQFGHMVSYDDSTVGSVLIEEAVNQLRLVEPSSELVLAAKAVGICMGD
jgi:6-phosphofructokinase 1